MKIDCLILGAYQTNCYILRESESAEHCLIIDAGPEVSKLIDFLREHKLNPTAVALTHGHIDHIAGVAALRSESATIKVYIHKLDAKLLTDANANLSAMTGEPFSTEPAEFSLQDGGTIDEAGIKLQVLHTPGHTPGGICLYSKDEQVVFTDDTLFANSVGRTDFPGGNTTQLAKSIKEKLLALPDETVCLPGHGPATTISEEKKHNPFLQ